MNKILILYVSVVMLSIVGCKEKNMSQSTSYAIRLKKGVDLKKAIQQFVDSNKIEAGWIASCAGSLTQYQIRFANQPKGSSDTGHFEIVSLVVLFLVMVVTYTLQ